MVMNADHEEVPGIRFNRVAYELEKVTAINADRRFNDFPLE